MKKMQIFIFLAVVIVPLNLLASNIEIPSGWRVPSGDEKMEIWGPQGKAIYNSVKGDFNNDGIAAGGVASTHYRLF